MKWLGWITSFIEWLVKLGSSPVAAQAEKTGRLEERLEQKEANDVAIEKARAASDAVIDSGVLNDPFNRDNL